MQRVVEPEILDSLPEGHPDADAGRRDLRVLNFLMGTHRWLRRAVCEAVRDAGAQSVLELGAGDGSLPLGLPGAVRDGVRWTVVERAARPAAWPEHWGWVRGDVLDECVPWPAADVGVVNLMLHHFEADALRGILRRLCGSCERVLICEPVRRSFHFAQLALLHGVLHPVTRHDARVSIRAGFQRGELGKFFPEGWQLRERVDWRGVLSVEARRIGRMLR